MADQINNPWLWLFVGQLILLVLLQTVRIQRLEREPRATQRDALAQAAMQGLIAGHFAHYGHESYWAPKDIADHAYEVADEMLKARSA